MIAPCEPAQDSCGPNEVWSYGADAQPILERYVRVRASLRPVKKFGARLGLGDRGGMVGGLLWGRERTARPNIVKKNAFSQRNTESGLHLSAWYQ